MQITISPKRIGFAVGVLVLLIGAFFVGYTVADRGGQHDQGKKEGIALTNAKYAKGKPAYQTIYQRGWDAGYNGGFDDGRAEGTRAGKRSGAAEAFSGYGGSWEIGRFYIVHIGQPSGNAPFTLEERLAMDTGQSYNICPDNSDKICGGPF
jgi:hypothetical protein